MSISVANTMHHNAQVKNHFRNKCFVCCKVHISLCTHCRTDLFSDSNLWSRHSSLLYTPSCVLDQNQTVQLPLPCQYFAFQRMAVGLSAKIYKDAKKQILKKKCKYFLILNCLIWKDPAQRLLPYVLRSDDLFVPCANMILGIETLCTMQYTY